jgi:hypothetical protein
VTVPCYITGDVASKELLNTREDVDRILRYIGHSPPPVFGHGNTKCRPPLQNLVTPEEFHLDGTQRN